MPFDITINFSFLQELLSQSNAFLVAWKLIQYGGWVIFAYLCVNGLFRIWLGWRQRLYTSRWNFTLLAIDIPKDNEQSPKAVEYIFSQLSGAYSNTNLIEKYWHGKVQEPLSFEIVSDGGYLQFYIYTVDGFRDLVEATIYAQYPDAIITEVEDYAKPLKTIKFPSNEYDMWGTEMKFTKNDAYPIRTYPMFEHTLSQELKDPMAGMLETLSRIRPGEKIWLQLVLIPITDSWAKEGKSLVKELTGEQNGGNKTIADRVGDVPLKALSMIDEAIFPASSDKAANEPFTMMRLTPGENDVLKAVQGKISKIGFKSVYRVIYLSPKELFDMKRGVSGTIGAIQQFSTLDLNALLPGAESTTWVNYFMVKTRSALRQNRLLNRYVNRAIDGIKLILNTEELATLYHFPMATVKAPLLAKTEAKRGEPPVGLPAESAPSTAPPSTEVEEDAEEEPDEFISLLEEVAAKREGAINVKEEIPEELLEENINKSEDNIEGVAVKKEAAVKEPMVKSRGGVPGNLPIGH